MAESEFDNGRSAIVLYGTETGTSQDIAEEISRCLERLHFSCDVAGLDDVNYSQLAPYALTVFVVATTGQGDFPDNARKFWTSLLRKKLSSTTLLGVDYALVGLGDSSYAKFNWAARKLDKRLKQLGAEPIVESCEADEQGDDSTDGAFLSWLKTFQESVLDQFPLAEGQEPISSDTVLPSKWQLEEIAINGDQPHPPTITDGHHTPDTDEIPPSPDSIPVVLEKNDRVTPSDHFQDVRFLSLTTEQHVDYLPGDALAISPQNMPSDVSTLIDLMSWQETADIPIHLTSTRASSSSSNFLPTLANKRTTLRALLTTHLDICAIPRRSFFAAIANHTTDDMHRERLLEFTDPQYLDEYYDYATRPRRSMLEILQEFDSVRLPWQEATNIFPPLRPRQFSIASGGVKKHGADGSTTTMTTTTTRFELLVAIVKYRTVIKRVRQGVCTRYLAQLPVGTPLNVTLKTEGRFFPKAGQAAGERHLLIGAGTGVAPLRALIHEKASGQDPRGDTALVFGCRSEKADYFFRDEWEGMMTTAAAHDAARLEVVTAFSRDQTAKVYIQDRIREQSGLVWRSLWEGGGTVVVCGSSGQMPKAVRQALVDALVREALLRRRQSAPTADADVGDAPGESEQQLPATAEDAEQYLARLEKEGRYKQETWS